MCPHCPVRVNLRLRSHDYSSVGAYFVTVCTAQRRPLFGSIYSTGMILTAMGAAVNDAWHDLPAHHWPIELDEFIIMPDHIHGIIVFSDPGRGDLADTLPIDWTGRSTLGSVVGGFKSSAARRIRRLSGVHRGPVWQRGYYDRIIRSDTALDRVRRYIAMNPPRAIERMRASGTPRT